MAKCPICNTRKGKRECLMVDGFICSLCCGTNRKAASCSGCPFYKKPQRKYGDVPAYRVDEMDGNQELEDYSYAIESAICSFDAMKNGSVKDDDAIRTIELLIDRYHFGDQQIDTDNPFVLECFHYVDEVIKKDMPDIDHNVLVKILAVIRFVARRRTNIGREYMEIIHRYVGKRIDTGLRVLPGIS
jgi:hypothetical protein